MSDSADRWGTSSPSIVPAVEPAGTHPEPPVAYARFSVRVRALLLDAVVVTAGLLVVVALAELTRDVPGAGRVLVVAFLGAVLLYEPLMVSRFGGTVGHRVANLRVVDDRSGGNPGLPRAAARFAIKGALGLLSFTTMALTRRHQAIHDQLTGSTVQIRDLQAADPRDYHHARNAAELPGLPSPARRSTVIVAYLVASFVALAVASAALLPDACLSGRRCTDGETLLTGVLDAAWLAGMAGCVIAGWRGRLWGARARRPAPGAGVPNA